MRHLAEEEAKKPEPTEQDSASEAIGQMISETLAEGNLTVADADQPVDKLVAPLTFAEYQNSRPKRQEEEDDRKKQVEKFRIELDWSVKPPQKNENEPEPFAPTGLEIDEQMQTAKPAQREKKQRHGDESMRDVLNMKRAAEKPIVTVKKKRGLLSWLRGE
jgi:hypothetical protein